ncbi:MAG: energy transducer TonB [Sterolibacteriaceae bacterium]|uniref:Energy transducer TonB n=1 Tax=Candidatus Methylophosphatis roskildensis TaxID=2899263 RepID=A0A9D7E7Q3_9PROT|nr:energy transducer TonB [Candidatus Methylophosphatis roskildensis]
MAGFCRHAVDDDSPAAKFCTLALCLMASGLLHGLVLVVPWSTLGPFSMSGPAAERRAGPASRSIVDRTPTRLRVDLAVPRLPLVVEPPKDEVARPALALPRSIPEVAPKSAPEPEPQLPAAPEQPEPDDAAAGDAEGRTLPLPQYFPAEKLTRQPELADEMGDSLQESLEAGFRGHVVIRLFIDQTGKADKVRVMESSLPIQIEGLVVKSFFHARYRPGEIDGQPVMSEMTVAVDLSAGPELFQPASPVDVTVGAGTGKP